MQVDEDNLIALLAAIASGSLNSSSSLKCFFTEGFFSAISSVDAMLGVPVVYIAMWMINLDCWLWPGTLLQGLVTVNVSHLMSAGRP